MGSDLEPATSELPGDQLDDVAAARVRRELARLAADSASAPEVPAEVTARIVTALRNAAEPPPHR
ncbi:MAG: hypothetical protein AB1925_20340 [Actinomycetota bacterium]